MSLVRSWMQAQFLGGIDRLNDRSERITWAQRKGKFSTVWLAFIFVCCMAIVSGIVTWQSAGPPPNIRRDRVGENLNIRREKGVMPASLLPDERSPKPFIRDVVRMPDEVLLLLELPGGYWPPRKERLSCRFGNGTDTDQLTEVGGVQVYRFRTAAVRCPYPSAGFAWKARKLSVEVDGGDSFYHARLSDRKPLRWNRLVYEMWSTEEDVVLFVKGLSHSRDHLQDSSSILCVYDDGATEVPVTVAAQEVARCPHPHPSQVKALLGKALTLKINGSLLPSVVYYEPRNRAERRVRQVGRIHSRHQESSLDARRSEEIERFFRLRLGKPGAGGEEISETGGDARQEDLAVSADDTGRRKHLLCACNLIWNGAKFLKEWVMYHSFLGVDKFFLYDNNSDDELEDTVGELLSNNFQIARIPWPWNKAQESGFAHCALMAQQECTWMMYTDIDEYAFPKLWLNLSMVAGNLEGRPADGETFRSPVGKSQSTRLLEESVSFSGTQTPLLSLILDMSKPALGKEAVGQISLQCRDFGPSGLTEHPVQGLTVGYTCRVAALQRHKSIVLLAAIDRSLKNVIHHFELSPEYRTVKLSTYSAVINHYKYQAWVEFKAKFKRRVSAYVVDWTDSRNLNSQDRAPGLGTEALKPDNWEKEFCEVEDYALRDYVLQVFEISRETGMVWQ